ncbi:MAG TPA: cytochrome c [Terriglobales bacterium]|nr:cytochrome c [Terriglobales bacterium]
MQNQPRFKPLRQSDFFEDGRSSRPPVAGTVARGQLRADTYFYTGMMGAQAGDQMPFPVNEQVLERGRERFNIYCSPCHSRSGDGNGMIVQRGYRRPPSLHVERLRKAPLGHFFDVMTNGFGAMPDYAAQVSPGDRWAIVAYIRALQLSQSAPRTLVPAGQQVPSAPPQYPGTPGSGATTAPSSSSGNVQTPKGEQKQ